MKDTKKAKGLDFRSGVLLWTLGIMSQIGWSIESQWFNNFVYSKIDKNPDIITAMIICSAIATTLATFLFGTLTDRTGKRRTLISAGYILWGALTIAFSFTEFIGKEFYIVACISVVVADMLVSFFGSTGSDVGYSTWSTDIMNTSNSGQIGGIIAVNSVLGTILSGVIASALVGEEENYTRLFVAVGAMLVLFGVISIFAYSKKDDVEPSVRGSFSKQFFSIFNLKLLIQNKELMLVYIATSIYFTGFNTYYSYLGNYLIHYLGFTADMIGIIQCVPLVIAMLVAAPIANLINKNLHFAVTTIAICSAIIGMMFMTFIRPNTIDTAQLFNPILFIGILLIGIGYVIMLQVTKAWTKQLHPEGSKGQFEGIWCVSFALIPMVLGSLTSQAVIKNFGAYNGKTFGEVIYLPNEYLFIVGVIISAVSFIPLLAAWNLHKASKKKA